MPVPSTIDDLSTTASSNSPAGTDTPQDGDNYIRALSSFIAQLRDKLDGGTGGVTLVSPTITGTAVVSAALVTALSVSGTSGNIASNTYTPTLTGVDNIDSLSLHNAYYVRIGAIVLVFINCTLNANTGGAIANVRITLPIATTFSTGYEANGSGRALINTTEEEGYIQSNTATHGVVYTYTPQLTTNVLHQLRFSYTIQ